MQPPLASELARWLDRWIVALNSYDIDALVALVAPDIVWTDPAMFGEPVRGRNELRRFVLASLRAFPDVRFQAKGSPYIATDHDGLALAWTITGTFDGPLAWWGKRYGSEPPTFAPTGRRIEAEGVDLYEFRQGMLSRWTVVYDLFDVSVQAGLAPSPHGKLVRATLPGQRLMTRLRKGRRGGEAI